MHSDEGGSPKCGSVEATCDNRNWGLLHSVLSSDTNDICRAERRGKATNSSCAARRTAGATSSLSKSLRCDFKAACTAAVQR